VHGDDAELTALAGGVLAVGFHGDDVSIAPLDQLRAVSPGAVVLFGRNVGTTSEVRELVAALRAIGDVPPLVAIDQEGGTVARIRDGVASLPSAMAIGATGDPQLAHDLGVLLGRDLARLGISVDFAPVADVGSRLGGGAIGTRSYGDDPARVADFAVACARGLTRGGVAPALKHFPGHGATVEDSHHTLPRVTDGEALLRRRDLLPFARAIGAHAAPLVMTAHIIVDALDAERPATLSPHVLGDVLRDELGFDGVIVTDCLEMDAIAKGVGTVRGAVEALVAGADLLLVSHRLDVARDVVAAIVAAVHDGSLPRARLRDAYDRVMRLRAAYAKLQPSDAALDDDLPRAAACRAVTVVRGDIRLRAGKPVTVISFDDVRPSAAGASGAGARAAADETLNAALRARGVKCEHLRVAREPDDDDVTLLLEVLAKLGDREFLVVARNAYASPAQRAAIARLIALAPDTVVIAAALPHDAVLWQSARRVACIYGDTPIALEGCADVLTGRAAADGRLPVTLGDRVAVR
jgi:beta-N-acetylhexosaminidase